MKHLGVSVSKDHKNLLFAALKRKQFSPQLTVFRASRPEILPLSRCGKQQSAIEKAYAYREGGQTVYENERKSSQLRAMKRR